MIFMYINVFSQHLQRFTNALVVYAIAEIPTHAILVEVSQFLVQSLYLPIFTKISLFLPKSPYLLYNSSVERKYLKKSCLWVINMGNESIKLHIKSKRKWSQFSSEMRFSTQSNHETLSPSSCFGIHSSHKSLHFLTLMANGTKHAHAGFFKHWGQKENKKYYGRQKRSWARTWVRFWW